MILSQDLYLLVPVVSEGVLPSFFVCARPPQRCAVRISSISGRLKKVQADLILSMILD